MGTRVLVVPSGQAGAVKSAEAGGVPHSFATAGDSVDLSLAGVDAQVRANCRSFMRLNGDGDYARVT